LFDTLLCLQQPCYGRGTCSGFVVAAQAGKKIRKLAKSELPEVAKATDEVLRRWKEAVKAELPKDSGASSSKTEAADVASQPSVASVAEQQELSRQAPGMPVALPTYKVPQTGNAARDKIREQLAEALSAASPDVPGGGEPGVVACEVEEAIFKQNGGVNQK
jgi:hypothetical protein